ncbi:hypothetical protein IWW55_004506 [Coemansia sp. RSA 2706]|nr:hypothetical protein LPJ63_003687 [Coemansia sp. RSA 2711]KAJ2298309.1 hypothetical protein IWW55_004506 [Coemansia sp. RSA 2706]KAJ2309739.1 hypothetical protein IWW54_003576 [Coemansia sp. RSA 2705]KAJ2322921.1 hypothetical protein IWW51_003998 [Coemansia sp. RSA 2702]KAJ2368189.1 hypothetical protein H4S01_001723 [Coemansia sp. RSA 2610]KAJ2391851.1 hypothetical protein H4S02_001116 [Coemansia sp. RSA 2611]
MRNLLAYVLGLPPATKLAGFLYMLFSITTVVLHMRVVDDGIDRDAAAQAAADPARFFVLRAGTVASYPWTLVTGALTEGNALFIALGVLALGSVGAFLERQWGTRGYAQFLAAMCVVPALTSVLALVGMYAVTGRADLLYVPRVSGLAGVVSAFTVGLKQLVPDYNVKLLRGSLGFRVNEVPGMYTLVVPIMYTLLGNLGGVLLVNIGFLEGFVYLRFYRRSGSVRGDRSEAFAFATFFPEVARPVVGRVAGAVYAGAVRCRVVAADEGYQQAVDLEEAVESDADRRRALAAKALDQRLESTASTSQPPTEP